MKYIDSNEYSYSLTFNSKAVLAVDVLHCHRVLVRRVHVKEPSPSCALSALITDKEGGGTVTDTQTHTHAHTHRMTTVTLQHMHRALIEMMLLHVTGLCLIMNFETEVHVRKCSVDNEL